MSEYNDRSKDIGTYTKQADDDTIVCRCEEISKGEIRKAIYDGMYTLTEIRRYLRAGMGLCQGQTCGKLVKAIIAKELGVSPVSLESSMARSPMRPVEMKVLANERVGEQNES